MEITKARPGLRVRWRTAYGTRTGRVYEVGPVTGDVTVDYFAAVHGGWVRQRFSAENLEAVEEDG